MLLKWQVKKLRFQRLRDLLSSGMKRKVFLERTFYRKTIRPGKKRKKVLEECRKTRNDKELIISLKCFFESSFFEWDVRRSQRHPIKHLGWSFLQE